MRQISPKAIFVFSILAAINAFLNAAFCLFLCHATSIAHQLLYFVIPTTFYLTTVLTYRLLFKHLKFSLHQIPKNLPEDFAFQLYVLYYLILFNFFVHNTLLPVPVSRGFHQLLGAKFGTGSYCAGIILDPPYVELGENSIIGFGAVVCSHALEGENVSFEKVIIGSNVTIEDNAIVAAGALVTKNTHIKEGEIWAGIPAIKMKQGQKDIIPSIASYAS